MTRDSNTRYLRDLRSEYYWSDREINSASSLNVVVFSLFVLSITGAWFFSICFSPFVFRRSPLYSYIVSLVDLSRSMFIFSAPVSRTHRFIIQLFFSFFFPSVRINRNIELPTALRLSAAPPPHSHRHTSAFSLLLLFFFRLSTLERSARPTDRR